MDAKHTVPSDGAMVRVNCLSYIGGRLYHAGDVVKWKKAYGRIPRGAKVVDSAPKAAPAGEDVTLGEVKKRQKG